MNRLFKLLGITLLFIQSTAYATELTTYPLATIIEGLHDDKNTQMSKYAVEVLLKPDLQKQKLDVIFPKSVELPPALKIHIQQIILEKFNMENLPKTTDTAVLGQADEDEFQNDIPLKKLYSVYAIKFNFLPVQEALRNKTSLNNRNKVCRILQNYDVANQSGHFELRYTFIGDEKGMHIRLDYPQNLDAQHHKILESSLRFPKYLRIFDLNSEKYIASNFSQRVVVECGDIILKSNEDSR